ncbi:MAG TPA: FAD-binding protein [Candidatus Saccharimonadia bacterium]|nr:FAD-binding protein [Candidatus Saccharimonadia bacterium]
MCGLDPQFQTFRSAGAAFPDFPGADLARYACLRSTYTGAIAEMSPGTKDAAKTLKEAGEVFHTCLLTGVQARHIPIHYDTAATALRTNDAGEVIGVAALREGQPIEYHARRAVLITSGGYEYNPRMRKAFLDGSGKEGWAFYGSPANTGDGIRWRRGGHCRQRGAFARGRCGGLSATDVWGADGGATGTAPAAGVCSGSV